MKTIEMMLRQMTDASSIIQDLRDTLRTIDPQFPAAEQSFNNAVAALEQSLKGLRLGQTPDMVLIDIEEAMEAMGEVTGATVREDITARIFERFCVGK